MADRFESFTDTATDIQKATLIIIIIIVIIIIIITICSHTFFFFRFFFVVQQYQRGSKAKMIHTQRERNKGFKKKIKEIQIFVPCCHPPQKWKRRHWIQKYHTFYISNSLCRLLFRNLLNSQDSSSAQRTFCRLAAASFLFCDYHFQFQIVQRTLYRCK